MRTITIEENPSEIFRGFESKNVFIYLWQDRNLDPNRKIYPCKVFSLHRDNFFVILESFHHKQFSLLEGELFAFNEDLKYFFKLDVLEKSEHQITVSIPQKISILTEEESLKMNHILCEVYEKSDRKIVEYEGKEYMLYEGQREKVGGDFTRVPGHLKKLSKEDHDLFQEILGSEALRQEDLLYADLRSAPRAKPTKGKRALIAGEQFELYDLSTGGMSVVTDLSELFSKDQEILIEGFDDKHLDSPLQAIVRSVRDIEDMPGHFKVGIQFVE